MTTNAPREYTTLAAAQTLPVAFDLRWRAGSRRMRTCVTCVCDALLAGEQRQRKRTKEAAKQFAKAVEALLCNFAAATLLEPGAALQVPASRRNSRSLSNALERMHALGLIVFSRDRRACVEAQPRRYSTAVATTVLQEYLPRTFSWRDLLLTLGQGAASLEVRSVKDATKQRRKVRWRRTNETHRMTTDMQQVNSYLQVLPVTYDGNDVWTLPDRNGFLQRIYTAQHSRCVRIFNNGTFLHGGRLYGGWWLSMKKAERVAHIRLAGEAVTHCDYETMHLRLAYAHIGAPWPFSDHDDAYKAAYYGTRTAWKSCTNARLNSNGTLTQFPDSQTINFREAFKGRTPSEVYADIDCKHAALKRAGAFGSGLGRTLERKESDLMVTLLLRLKAKTIPALPIHDCLLVRVSQAQAVAELMEYAAREAFNCALPVLYK